MKHLGRLIDRKEPWPESCLQVILSKYSEGFRILNELMYNEGSCVPEAFHPIIQYFTMRSCNVSFSSVIRSFLYSEVIFY